MGKQQMLQIRTGLLFSMSFFASCFSFYWCYYVFFLYQFFVVTFFCYGFDLGFADLLVGDSSLLVVVAGGVEHYILNIL